MFTVMNWSSLASTKVAQFHDAATAIVHVNKKIKWAHCKLKQTFTAGCGSSAKRITDTSICVLFCNAQQFWQVQFQDATTAKSWTTKQLTTASTAKQIIASDERDKVRDPVENKHLS